MRNLGYGTISITGVPAGATVKSATLLWDVLADEADPAFAQGTFGGKAITGTAWASGASPCWSQAGSNWSYEANVTSLVNGNGSYALAGFATGESDGADPWNVGTVAPLAEGASLVVVYQLASMPPTDIQIAAGATETDSGNTASATLDGFTVTAPASVKTTYIVGDGQEAGNTASFDGTTLPDVSFPGADPQAVPDYSEGNLWDTVTTDVSALASPGGTSASLSVTGNADCIVWVGQVLAVPAPLRYVALGDSYSSGEANPPFVTAKGKCDLSRSHAWPELLAAEDSHLQLAADLACSGATTAALESGFKGQPAELKAMKPLDPSVITITIAGNNVGFRSVLENCYLWIVCDKDGALATASRKISGLASVMPGIYREIKAAAPKGARIYVVGYPRLVPLSRHNVSLHCPWLSGTVQAKLNALAVKLNGVLAAAAKKAGVDYIPTLSAFSGHELCSAHPWVRALQPNNREYSGHPLLRGQEALAAIVRKVIG